MHRLLTLLSIIVIVSGCGTPGGVTPEKKTRAPDRDVQVSDTLDIQSLLARAQVSTEPQATELRLRAAQLAIEAGNADQAGNILDMDSLAQDQDFARRHALLRAEIALQNDNAEAALKWLNDPSIAPNSLTEAERIQLGLLRSRAFFIARSYLASARERIFLDGSLDTATRQENHEEIFNALMEIPLKNLRDRAENAITSDLRGWLSLAALSRQYQHDPLRQLEELNRWRQVWRSHPAASQLPSSLATLSKVVANQPKSIALLLPLQGGLGIYGRAIRDSIIASRFEMERNVRITVFDTSNVDIVEVMNKAVADGAELIIGPLDRDKVTVLANLPSLPVPVLALNRTQLGVIHPRLYQFGLAPEDEMVQVADQVFKEGKKNALVLFPEGDWGLRNFEAFRNRWLSLGGNIIDSSGYNEQKNYSEIVKQLLDVDQSEERASTLRRIIGERFEFTPRRRQDIDFVFLLGNQAQARGINPTLAFYYAEDIPVYSTSHVHQANDSRIESIDLNGIRFCDIPWKLTLTDSVQLAIQNTWPASKSSLAPFYALGVDAFRIYPRLEQLKLIQAEKVYGATGILQLNANNVIVRKLMWARFANGEVKSVPLVMDTLDSE